MPSITKKDRPLTPAHFAEFEECYGPDPNVRDPKYRNPQQSKEDRWRSFHITELKERDFKIDSLKWLRDEGLGDADVIVSPEDLATEAIEELEAAVEDLNTIVEMLGNGYECRE